jgi:hypothetical protein
VVSDRYAVYDYVDVQHRQAERVNDFATPRVINLLCRVECFGLSVSPWVAG